MFSKEQEREDSVEKLTEPTEHKAESTQHRYEHEEGMRWKHGWMNGDDLFRSFFNVLPGGIGTNWREVNGDGSGTVK